MMLISEITSCRFMSLRILSYIFFFFFSSRRRHTRSYGDWSSDVCSSDLNMFDRHEHVSLDLRVTLERLAHEERPDAEDRKSVVYGKSVDLGGRRSIKKKKKREQDEKQRQDIQREHKVCTQHRQPRVASHV